jgi:hypothetical protein
MKTTSHITALATALITVMVGTATSANAQYKATGDDGITASPKVRAQLDERNARSVTAKPALQTMSCPKCKDAWVATADTNPKGLGARTLMGSPTKLVAQHLCPGCGADMSVAGTGKAKHMVTSHKCSSCGAEELACCSPKGSGAVATKGMGPKFKVAPVK